MLANQGNTEVKKNRPVNLNLFSMRFPVTAITSIVHRLSGLLLFLVIPVFLYYFDQSLASQGGFDRLMKAMSCPVAKFIIWVIGSAMIYHVVAGVRHLIMDAGHGEEKQSGRYGAWTVIFISVLISLLFAGWVWA